MTRALKTLLPAALVLCLTLAPLGYAQMRVQLPAGTQVPLAFVTRVDSSTAREGEAVAFTVASDVLIERHAVIRKGSTAQGLVVSVTPPGIFGRNARVHIAFVQVVAADGLPIRLAPIDVTPDNLREARDAAGAAGASVAGLILLGPIGVAAGALVRGGHVTIPPGAVAVTSTIASAQVTLP
ncbi:MAG: hypothetical protein QN168_07895 [Armatimonadota bacterium]|nr:hypothetical protein [Armatimonadota bacterium]